MLVLSAMLLSSAARAAQGAPAAEGAGFTGSVSCMDCHERFYELWAPSHHGLAMQPYTPGFARGKLTPQVETVTVAETLTAKETKYRAFVGEGEGWMVEYAPDGEKKYPIVHVLGGKNTYYFLTPMERGKLQTMPLAYEVKDKRWYDMAGSAVRHFAEVEDEALDWRERPYTFNSACYGCHVSQLATNYTLDTDSYNTTWAEPGINCETCHGPGAEHIRAAHELAPGEKMDDLKLIVTSGFTAAQNNSLCAPCHAKMRPITEGFVPGEDYFDHYDLSTLEDRDFYPDGRDLGENYTFTSWLMSPCGKAGQLDCVDCHTSSGRYRFAEENHNGACLPCHQEHVDNPKAHSHHPADLATDDCISCHMPLSRFANMNRSDHSMRPPAPAATLEFGSPNACNMCHEDQDAAWSEKYVREWYGNDYQQPILEIGRLIDAARKADWTRLPDMLAYIAREDRDEVVAASLIRLLRGNDSEAKWPALLKALEDPSPLVRSSAADGLTNYFAPETIDALLKRTRDESRLVRIRSAAALASVPREAVAEEDWQHLSRATVEWENSLSSRLDDPYTHYNLGNFNMSQGQHLAAARSFETSLALDPRNLLSLVNVSLAYNVLGQNDKAEESLRKALKVDPRNDAAHLNLALLLAELNRMDEAEQAFRNTLEANPRSAVAAFNLGVLLLAKDAGQGLYWCRKASRLRPEDGRYAYTYAYCLNETGDTDEAIEELQKMVDGKTDYPPAYSLLGQLYMQQGRKEEALAAYREGVSNQAISLRDYQMFEMAVSAQ